MKIKKYNESNNDKSLIILDLDENLIHSIWKNYEEVPYSYMNAHKIFNGDILTKKRPYVEKLINYIFNNFKVAIWTAAGEEYAKEILKYLNIDENKLEFLFTEKNCTIKYKSESGELIYLKDLNKIKGKYNLEKVLIIDDNADGCARNYGNLLRTKPWHGDDDDNELLKVIKYLEKIKNMPNFRRIEKRGWSYNI